MRVPVCTENLICVDEVTESAKLAECSGYTPFHTFAVEPLRPPKFRLLCRRGSKFLERTQESYRVFPAQHADDMLIPDDGHLVDSIPVHLLEDGPQLGIRIGAF